MENRDFLSKEDFSMSRNHGHVRNELCKREGNMRKFVLIVVSILLLHFVYGCIPMYVARYDRTFYGRVVDAETGEPIEGTVVLGTWYSEFPGIAGAGKKFYDARETVTDKNGEFSIPGKGIRVMGNLKPMRVMIFKAGYNYVEGTWKSFKESFYYKDKVKWEGSKAIIPLKKLTMEERRKELGPPDPPDEAPLKKVILMLREIDKDRIEQGLDTRGIWRGEKYE